MPAIIRHRKLVYSLVSRNSSFSPLILIYLHMTFLNTPYGNTDIHCNVLFLALVLILRHSLFSFRLGVISFVSTFLSSQKQVYVIDSLYCLCLSILLISFQSFYYLSCSSSDWFVLLLLSPQAHNYAQVFFTVSTSCCHNF